MGLKSGLALVSSVASAFALSACAGDSSNKVPANIKNTFATKYANEKTTPPTTMPSDWVVIDKNGHLNYRLNLNKYCLITAVGKITHVRVLGANYIVMYTYENVTDSANSANCQANDNVCLEAAADCVKTSRLIASHIADILRADIPTSTEKSEDVLAYLKPPRN